jgi:hypothetical protein
MPTLTTLCKVLLDKNMMSLKSFFMTVTIGWQVLGPAAEPSDTKLRTLYNSLDPTSISQHLAFYELYTHRSWGQQALQDAWKLLSGATVYPQRLMADIPFTPQLIDALVAIVNKPTNQELVSLDEEVLKAFTQLSTRLEHHKLKGHHVWSEQEVLTLPPQEIDLARGIFLTLFGEDRTRIQSYEALIDLMALQILARLPQSATPQAKIRAINAFVFDEMGFRFPPHSIHIKNIDLYTDLPSVLDSHRGVCLGISILYMCLAQRLALPLEMITPPGHIYVRYHSGDEIINIETTARGIHIDSEHYLSVSTRSLQQRSLREVIGMTHFNQASVYWQRGEYAKALEAYQKAEPYLRGDPLLAELMGYILLLTGHREEGERMLWEVKDFIPAHAITKGTMIEDYFQGHVDADGIKWIFSKTEEDRQSILEKKQALEKILERYPRFRAGILSLAVTWMQLHRAREALDLLKNYEKMDDSDPEVHYYLSVLYAQRHHYPKAWEHLKKAETILKAHNYDPKDLRELRRELLTLCPE